jgi:hypothetical protein
MLFQENFLLRIDRFGKANKPKWTGKTYADQIQISLKSILHKSLDVSNGTLNVHGGETIRGDGRSIVDGWEQFVGHVLGGLGYHVLHSGLVVDRRFLDELGRNKSGCSWPTKQEQKTRPGWFRHDWSLSLLESITVEFFQWFASGRINRFLCAFFSSLIDILTWWILPFRFIDILLHFLVWHPFFANQLVILRWVVIIGVDFATWVTGKVSSNSVFAGLPPKMARDERFLRTPTFTSGKLPYQSIKRWSMKTCEGVRSGVIPMPVKKKLKWNDRCLASPS